MFNEENEATKVIKNNYLSFPYFFIQNLFAGIKVLEFERNVNTLALYKFRYEMIKKISRDLFLYMYKKSVN